MDPKSLAKKPERRGYTIVKEFTIDGRLQRPAMPGSNPIVIQMTEAEARPWVANGSLVPA